jgi:hypothetical protein
MRVDKTDATILTVIMVIVVGGCDARMPRCEDID